MVTCYGSTRKLKQVTTKVLRENVINSNEYISSEPQNSLGKWVWVGGQGEKKMAADSAFQISSPVSLNLQLPLGNHSSSPQQPGYTVVNTSIIKCWQKRTLQG